jgi:excisionase family DNA binding protein
VRLQADLFAVKKRILTEREAILAINTDNQLFYTRNQVAKIIGITPRTVDRWIGKGTLKRVKVGGIVRIPHSSLDKVLGGINA